MAARYFGVKQELKSAQTQVASCQFNSQTVDFAKLFVTKVLAADQEIDFETRLELENAVRNLQDKEILDAWQKFTNSQDEAEAQNQVKALLNVLLEKIK